MITSNINISSAGNVAVKASTSVSTNLVQTAANRIGILMHISDTQGNNAEATLNLNSSSLKLEILKSQEYAKKASLFFGSVFSGGFNADYMWQLLAEPTNEQINGSHLVTALSGIRNDLQGLENALHIHTTNYSIHLSTEDRDFLTRLKGLYGGVYNVALDYLVLKNPYEGEINITERQIALFAGFGGFSAYSGVNDIELEFYNLIQETIPSKSGGYHTSEAFFLQNNTYGYGITTLTIPTHAPEDLVEGEVGLYVGEGGFNAVPSGEGVEHIIEGYYYEGEFYLDENHTAIATKDIGILYIDIPSNQIYRYDITEEKFILLTSSGGIIIGYYDQIGNKFYSSYENQIFDDEIPESEGVLYLDEITGSLYRYKENVGYIIVSAGGDGLIVRGFFNPSNNLFYESYDTQNYSDPITGISSKLYWDILTNGFYLYVPTTEIFTRYHHRVGVDYLVFNTNYNGEISLGQHQAAIYIGQEGFTSTTALPSDSLVFGYYYNNNFYDDSAHELPSARQERILYVDLLSGTVYMYNQTDGFVPISSAGNSLIMGYYYNSSFYNDSEHTVLLQGRENVLYVDIATNTLYIFDGSNYLPIAGSSDGGNSITFGYYSSSNFYQNRSGSYPNYSYSSACTPDVNTVYVDRSNGVIYKYANSTYSPVTTGVSIQGNHININRYNDNSWTIKHPTFTTLQNVSTQSNSLINGINFDVELNEYFGHITGYSTINYSQSSQNSTIAQRTSDAAIAASYFILNTINQNTPTVSSSSLAAVYIGSGGFTATSQDYDFEIYYSWSNVPANSLEDSVYSAYVVRSKINSLDSRITLLEQNGGGSGSGEGGGTTDHNLLLHRFSTDFEETVTPQHDIGVIDGLQTALNNLSGATTWTATAPLILTKQTTPVYSNTLSLSPLTIPALAEDTTTGVLLTGITYTETAQARTLTRTTIGFSDSATSGTIARRRSDNSLAASYILLTNNINSTSVSTGESAIYIGAGGFNSTAAVNQTDFDVYDAYPSTRPNSGIDKLISARGLYDKISALEGSIGQSTGTIVLDDNGGLEYNQQNKLQIKSGGITLSMLESSIQSATTSSFGLVKLGDGNNLTIGNKIYGVGKTSDGQLAVSVPWEAGSQGTTYTEGNGISISNNVISLRANTNNQVSYSGNDVDKSSDRQGRRYAIRTTSDGYPYVSVPWDEAPVYSSLSAVENSSSESLCTRGEKYIWNHKSDFTGYTNNNKLSTNYIQNDANWSSFSGYSSSNKLSTNYIDNVAGWTSNAGTVTSVQVQAGTGLSSSVNTSQSVSLSTTISIASTHKLPTTDEWNNKANTSALNSYLSKTTGDLQTVASAVTFGGNVTTNGKFFDSSDIRLKRKIKELTSLLDSIEDIPVVQFEYKAKEGQKYIGTLAQKLLPLFPELLAQDDDGYYSVDYDGLAAIAIQGIKELYKIVKELEKEVYGYN